MAMRLVPKDSDTAALILTDTGVGSVLSSMASDSAIGLNWLSVVNWKMGAGSPLSGVTVLAARLILVLSGVSRSTPLPYGMVVASAADFVLGF